MEIYEFKKVKFDLILTIKKNLEFLLNLINFKDTFKTCISLRYKHSLYLYCVFFNLFLICKTGFNTIIKGYLCVKIPYFRYTINLIKP